MTYSVKNPTIAEVMNLRSGALASAFDAIGDEYDRAIQLRTSLHLEAQKGSPLYVCSICGVTVFLNSMHKERKFYFRHAHEDGSCPLETGGKLSQDEINSRRYNGAKESEQHIRMKEFIRRSLLADPAFSDVRVEGRWTDSLTGAYRKPDVAATFRGLRIAFEVQLSSTYINIVAGRRLFYEQQGAMLFWVFSRFDEGMRKITQDDVYFNNNQNAFAVSEQTLSQSESARRFHLECIWREPTTSTDVTDLVYRTVGFDELKLDLSKQQAYFFDYYGALEKVKKQEAEKILQLQLARERVAFERLANRHESARRYFRYCWGEWQSKSVEFEACWENLIECFDEIDEDLPEHANELPHNVFNIIYSICEGSPVGWDYQALIEVVHRILPGENRMRVSAYLPWYWKAITVYQRAELIKQQDVSKKWQRKVTAHREALKQGAMAREKPDPSVVGLLGFLFPELRQT